MGLHLRDKKRLLCILAVVTLVVSASGHGPCRHIKRRTKRIITKLESVYELINRVEELKSEHKECSVDDGDIRKAVNKVSKQVDKPEADINLTPLTTGSASCNSLTTVKVPKSYAKCVAQMDTTQITEQNARIWCLRVALWQFNHELENDLDDESEQDIEIVQEKDADKIDVNTNTRSKRQVQKVRFLAPNDMTQPPTGSRTRQEYRTLTPDQRKRFHDALNVLYQEKTLRHFALVHKRALRSKGAHGDAAFLSWHRPFLSLFEEALRNVDPSVTLPYWDSSFDSNMATAPDLSVMWDADHLGTGSGVVINGPFANWKTKKTPLTRNVANGGSPVKQSRIDLVMSLCTHADFRHHWENTHNGVHRWVGGTMARSLSASDPVFYMHHAFIDYQWEKFRERQSAICGIDPTYDYPPAENYRHDPGESMDGMKFLQNIDGIADYWTQNWYQYADTPSCDNNCGNSADLFCDLEKNVCVSETTFLVPNGSRKKRQISPSAATQSVYITSYDGGYRSNNCSRNPYGKNCRIPKIKGRVEQSDVQLICGLDEKRALLVEIEETITRELKEDESFPPESQEIIFRASPEEPNDCRTYETNTYDICSALVNKKRINGAKRLKQKARSES